eukprot:12522713-Prorocentrum_lima.AAC.1
MQPCVVFTVRRSDAFVVLHERCDVQNALSVTVPGLVQERGQSKEERKNFPRTQELSLRVLRLFRMRRSASPGDDSG